MSFFFSEANLAFRKNGTSFILHEQNFDALYSVLVNFKSIDEECKHRSWDLLLKGKLHFPFITVIIRSTHVSWAFVVFVTGFALSFVCTAHVLVTFVLFVTGFALNLVLSTHILCTLFFLFTTGFALSLIHSAHTLYIFVFIYDWFCFVLHPHSTFYSHLFYLGLGVSSTLHTFDTHLLNS